MKYISNDLVILFSLLYNTTH